MTAFRCGQLVPAISYNSGTHLNYFARGKEVYSQYYGYLIRIPAQHVPAFNPVMMAKMVDWLRTSDSEECALWWEKYWTSVHDPCRLNAEVQLPWLIVDM